jgi:radical SAM protein with 4Fe4S-binding SPASM domain
MSVKTGTNTVGGASRLDTDDRIVPDYMESVGHEKVEAMLLRNQVPKFGDRFARYRANYHRSLNYDKNDYVPDFPLTVNMELVNRCNLACIMCYTANHKGKKHTLSLERIRQIAEEAKQHEMPALVLGLGAEALLYKDIRDVITTANEAGIMDLFLYTNGVLLTEKMSEFLIRSGVTRLHVSLDAATPETFLKIRQKPEFERIERNIHKFLEVRKRLGAELPLLRVSFCVQELNLHEREAFLKKWEGVADRVDFQLMSPEKHVDEVRETGTVSDLPHYHPELLEKPWCALPFNSLHVWSDGNVTPCCAFLGKNLVVGNVAEESLEEIWKGERLGEIRRQFRTGQLNPTCQLCIAGRDTDSFYKALKD